MEGVVEETLIIFYFILLNLLLFYAEKLKNIIDRHNKMLGITILISVFSITP